MFLTALFPLLGLAAPSPEAAQKCAQIHATYKTCAVRYSYDGDIFHFIYDKQNVQVACEDGKQLAYFDRLDDMDMSSVLMYPYLTGATPLPETRQNWDPGRLRSEALFKTTFGSGEDDVRAQLGHKVRAGETVLVAAKKESV